MRALNKLLAIAALGGALGACYVEEPHHTYYVTRTCRAGYVWDGYHCRLQYY